MSSVVKRTKAKHASFNWFHRQVLNVIKSGPIPEHVCLLLDGSRRYARKNKMSVLEGQAIGRDLMDNVLEWCNYLDIPNVTMYIFSIENFKKTNEELDGILLLMVEKYKEILNNLEKFNRFDYCLRYIGNASLIPRELKELMDEVYIKTSNNKYFFNIGYAYTGRDEIYRTMKIISSGVKLQEILMEDINVEFFNQLLSGPKIDIIIRTSGEVRLSDFMFWQSHTAHIFFVQVLWPEFNIWYFIFCIFNYQRHLKDFCKVEAYLGFNAQSHLTDKSKRFVQKYKNRELIELKLQINEH